MTADPLAFVYEAAAQRMMDVIRCAACGREIKRVRLFYGHVERQPAGTAHYARPVRRSEQNRSMTRVPLAASRGSAPSAGRRSTAAGAAK